MTFGDALERMKAGQKMTREGVRAYLVVQSIDCEPMPYTATDADIFADDWEAVL